MENGIETTIATSSAQLVGLSGLETLYANLGSKVLFGLAIIGALTITIIFLVGFWNLVIKNVLPKRMKQIK